MKKLLQLILSMSLLIIFSCSGDEGDAQGVDDILSNDWVLTDFTVYDSETCSAEQLHSVADGAGAGIMKISNGDDCFYLDNFFNGIAGYTSNCPTVDNGAGDVPDPDFMLSAEFYLELNSVEGNATGGTYMRTMYGTYTSAYGDKLPGQIYETPFSSYGRWYIKGNKMTMQGLASIAPYDGTAADRVTANEEAEIEFHRSEAPGSLQLTRKFDVDADGDIDCVTYLFRETENYKLKGCKDKIAINYLSVDEDGLDFKATEEDGSCHYPVEEAAGDCVLMDQSDDNADGEYSLEETTKLDGVIDCNGICQYEDILAWKGDGVCDDNGAGFDCEAFDWDGWDCACAEECLATYDEDTNLSDEVAGGDYDIAIGEGNDLNSIYTAINCQEACNVKECGYDVGSVANQTSWDCCSADCILLLNTLDGGTYMDGASCMDHNNSTWIGEGVNNCFTDAGAIALWDDDSDTTCGTGVDHDGDAETPLACTTCPDVNQNGACDCTEDDDDGDSTLATCTDTTPADGVCDCTVNGDDGSSTCTPTINSCTEDVEHADEASCVADDTPVLDDDLVVQGQDVCDADDVAASNVPAGCNEGECNFFRPSGTDIGMLCDQSGGTTWDAETSKCMASDGTEMTGYNQETCEDDDFDCSVLGGDGTCDTECNTGACNWDGDDCED